MRIQPWPRLQHCSCSHKYRWHFFHFSLFSFVPYPFSCSLFFPFFSIFHFIFLYFFFFVFNFYFSFLILIYLLSFFYLSSLKKKKKLLTKKELSVSPAASAGFLPRPKVLLCREALPRGGAGSRALREPTCPPGRPRTCPETQPPPPRREGRAPSITAGSL